MIDFSEEIRLWSTVLPLAAKTCQMDRTKKLYMALLDTCREHREIDANVIIALAGALSFAINVAVLGFIADRLSDKGGA